MIYKHNRRLVVQKPGTNTKYKIPVLTAETDHSYPFSVPAASIEVLAGDALYDYISDVEFDDIVRLQVCDTYSTYEKDVWLDIFEGRILDVKSQWGTNTSATLVCAGHSNPAAYYDLTSAYTQTTAIDSGTIVKYWNPQLKRIQVTAPTSTFSMPYTIKESQKKLKDVFLDVEETSGYTYYFDTRVLYDANLNLSNVYLDYKQLSLTPTTKYKVVQGSPRLLSANFTVAGSNFYNMIVVYGATATNGAQSSGAAFNYPLIDKYDTRSLITTDTAFTDGVVCTAFANGLLPFVVELRITGEATLLLTPQAKVGDLVEVIIKDIDVKGTSLTTYLRVVKVSHSLEEENATTKLQFGKVHNSPEDYTAEFKRTGRLVKNMFRT